MELLFKQDIKPKTDIKSPQNIIAYYNWKKDGKRGKVQYPTGIKVRPSNFSNQRAVKHTHKHKINAVLDNMRLLFTEEQIEADRKGLPIDKAVLIRVINEALGIKEVKEADIKYYTEYLPVYLKRLDKMKNQQGGIGLTKETQKTYKSSAQCYKAYEEKRIKEGYSPMSLQYATTEEIDEYQDYLVDEKGYAPDTINKRIGMVKAVSRYAKKRKHLVSEDLTEYEVPSKQPRKKEDIVFLTPEEVEKITTPQEGLPDYLVNTQRIVILNLTTAQRISDVMKLTDRSFRAEKGGSFTAIIRQQKTGKEVNIPIVDERAVEVIKTGLFRAISHQKYNTYVKELGQRVGIDQIIKSNKIKDKRKTEIETEKFRFITSHTFRRTALTNLYQGNPPLPEYLILNISGHSKSSQLHQYLGIDPNKEAQAREIRKWMERQKETQVE